MLLIDSISHLFKPPAPEVVKARMLHAAQLDLLKAQSQAEGHEAAAQAYHAEAAMLAARIDRLKTGQGPVFYVEKHDRRAHA